MRTVGMKLRTRKRMDDRGVSIVLEYVLLVAILSSIIFFVNITLNNQLKEGHTSDVIENQFSDVSSQMSSQLVDVMTISPKNGYVKSKIYMPSTIGGNDFKAGFKSQGDWDYIYIESNDGKNSKYLGLGASTLNFRPQGFTYSLSEEHEVSYKKESAVYPSAVLIPRPATFYVNKMDQIEFDVSRSSAYGWWTWKLELWNGTIYEGNKDDPKVSVGVDWSDVKDNCQYYISNETALCNVTLTVSDTIYHLNDTDKETIKIVEEINDSDPDLFIKKYVNPPQAAPGEPFEIHVYFQGKGFITEGEDQDLTVVHTLDTSGSMEYESFYNSLSGYVTPNNWSVNYNVGDSFKNDCLYVEAYTTDSMSPWFDGIDKDDAISLRIEKSNGQQFYASSELGAEHGVGYSEKVTPNELGNWTFKVVGAVPKEIDLNLKIYRCDSFLGFCFGCSEVDSFSTSYEPVYHTNNVELPSGYTQNEYRYLKTYLSSGYTNDFFMWLEDDLCSDVCTYNDIPPDNYTINVAPRRSDSTYYEGYADISKIDSARIASINFNNGTEDDLVGLVDYNSDAYKHDVNTSMFLDYLTTDVENVDSEIKALTAGGATNIYDALVKSDEVLHEDTSYVEGTKPMIILLTDGVPTEGDPNCNGVDFCPEGAQKAIQEAEDIKSTDIGEENISICTIGFGYNFNETFLKTISSPMPGNTSQKCMYTATSVDELTDAYKDIENSFRLAAKDVTVTDVVPSNLELKEDSVEIKAAGNATLSEYTIKDTAVGKAISFNASEVYINDEIELVFEIVADEPGDYQLDVGGVSNVTYEPYPFNGDIKTVNLTVLNGRCSESQRTTVSVS